MTRNAKTFERPRNPGEVDSVTQYAVPDSFTKSLLHFNGPNDVPLFTDEIGARVWTPGNNARLSTLQMKFGESSAIFNTGTGDHLLGDASSDFAFGTGDFTIDFWIKASSTFTQNILIFDFRPLSTNGAYPALYISQTTPRFTYWVNVGARLTSTTAVVSGVWYHIAITRASGTTRLFVSGVQEGGTYADANNYLVGANRPLLSGDGVNNPATLGLNGWIDEFRVSKGIARWTSNFTPPTAQYS